MSSLRRILTLFASLTNDDHPHENAQSTSEIGVGGKPDLPEVNQSNVNVKQASDNEVQPTDLISLDEIAQLANSQIQTIRNRLTNARRCDDPKQRPPSPAVKGAGRHRSCYSYAEFRAWVVENWCVVAPLFPVSFAEAKAILAKGESV